MILRAGKETFTIDRKGITHETFTRRYALVNLKVKLETARQELQTAPDKRRQREKVRRLERQFDKLNLSL